MARLRFTLQLFAVLAFLVLVTSATQAQVQATRTWVSGVGDDFNPCTRTAPCKTFAGAFSKTFINGEINVLDPGDYAPITITNSITIDATGTYAGIQAPPGVAGITISIDPAGGVGDVLHTVRLRGLSISGPGVLTKAGSRGINVTSANFADLKLILEDSVIDGFVNEGILWSNNGGNLVVKNSTIKNNDGAGIKVDSASSNLVHVTVNHTSLVLNGEGIRFEDNVRGGVIDSIISNNTTNGVAVVNVSAPSVMQLDHTLISENGQAGVLAGGGVTYGTAQLSNCMIIHNNVGVQANANGLVKSWGNNHLSINNTNGTFSAPLLTEQ